MPVKWGKKSLVRQTRRKGKKEAKRKSFPRMCFGQFKLLLGNDNAKIGLLPQKKQLTYLNKSSIM